ncbi:MAG: hypothetical protein GY720_02720 [bacterium]|nr:hypothetical protein [bacterium]
MPPAVVIIIVAAIHLIPGWAVAANIPLLRELRPLSARLATAVALSIAQMMLLGMGLIAIGAATPTVIVVGNVAVTSVLAVTARTALRRDFAIGVAAVRAYRFEWPSVAVLWVLSVVVASYVLIALGDLPARVSSWGYAADLDEILTAGGLPATTVEYGETIDFVATKVGGFAWLAAVGVMSGLDSLSSVRFLSLAPLFGALVAAWAIFRTFLGRLGAAAGIVLFFHQTGLGLVLGEKLRVLTLEGAGITLALLAVWAVVAADQQSKPQLHWLAAGMVALAGFTHGVVALVVVVFVACYQLARIILRKLSWRQIARNAVILGVVPALLIFGGLRLLFPAPGFAVSGGEFELVDGDGDPTRALYDILQGRSIDNVSAPESPTAKDYLNRFFSRAFVDSSVLPTSNRAVMALGVVALVAASWLLKRRQAALTVLLFLVALMGVALAFSYRYELFIYTSNPLRRHFAYAGVALMGLLLVAVSGIRWRPSRGSNTIKVALSIGLAAGVSWALATKADSWASNGLSGHDEAALEWLRSSTPPDAQILTNVRTTGSFALLAERSSLTEGDAVYTFPERLTIALDVLNSAQGWFENPSHAYLEANGVDYVVVAVGRPFPMAGNAYAPITSLELFNAQTYLELESRNASIAIYSVTPSAEIAAMASGELGQLMLESNLGPTEARKEMVLLGRSASEVSIVLTDVYGLNKRRVLDELVAGGYETREIVEILAEDDVPRWTMRRLVQAEVPTNEIIESFASVYNLSEGQIAELEATIEELLADS